jgi:hypothetical protein
MSEIQKGVGTNHSWEFWFNDDLKGLSHEMDFNNVDEN